MKALVKHVRLLPAVIAVGGVLLGVKCVGLASVAWAQDQQSATSKAEAVLARETAPLPKDVANEDTDSSSAEVDVLSSLAKRRAVLDAREAEIRMREDVLAAAESRVDGKIGTLKQLQDKITALLGQRDDQEKLQIAALVKTYSAMKAKDAARIFNGLADDVLLTVAQTMKSDALAPILAAMNPDAAQKLTVKLANRLKLPDVAAPAAAPAPAAPAPAAPAAAPGVQAKAGP